MSFSIEKQRILSNDDYINMGKNCLDECFEIINMDGWQIHKRCGNGDTVEYLEHEIHGKIFKFTGQIKCSANILANELFLKIERLTDWCPSFVESKILQKIDENTDITYQVAAGGGGGVVSPRDFVNLRHLGTRSGSLFSTARCVEYPGAPERSKYIRGATRIGCWVITPLEDGGTTRFCSMMSADMRGFLPRIIVDAAHTTVMLDYARHLRRHCAQIS